MTVTDANVVTGCYLVDNVAQIDLKTKNIILVIKNINEINNINEIFMTCCIGCDSVL